MLCYSPSINADESVSLWVGESYTFSTPTSFKKDNVTRNYSSFEWQIASPSDQLDYDIYTDKNTATITLKRMFIGERILKCVCNYTDTRPTPHIYTFHISCNKVEISIFPTTMEMDINDSRTLQYQFSPITSNPPAEVTFSSSNTSVALVDLFGKVTAVGSGSATITASTNYGTTATCEIMVNPMLVTSISLDQTTLTLEKGASHSLKATVLPAEATDKSVTWTSSNENVATVDATGRVTAVSKGMATITATTNDGTNLSASCIVSVTAVQPTGITLGQEEAEMHVGEQLKLTAAILPTEATQRVTWSSSDPAVARVVGGTVYALDWGECVITAKSVDNSNLTADCLIYVLPEQQANSTDVNGDGKTDVSDVNVVINAILKVN